MFQHFVFLLWHLTPFYTKTFRITSRKRMYMRSEGEWEKETASPRSMPKTPYACEDHGHVELDGFFDDFVVTNGTAGLNDRMNAGFVGF